MKENKNTIPGLFTPQMAVLCVVGLVLNSVFAKLAVLFGWPLYIDNIGSVLVAALGGSLPGMTVGFISNLINAISDPITMYYGILTVFIALAATIFSYNGLLKKVWGCILAALVFVAIGGAVGSCMTWMLYGGGIGTGISQPYALMLLDKGFPEFWAQFTADVLIDIPDKLITVFAVALLLRFYPKKLYNLFPYSYIYDRSITDAREARRRAKAYYRKISVKTRILSVIAISAVTIGVISTAIGVYLNRQDALISLSDTAVSSASVSAALIDGDNVDEYAVQGEGYEEEYAELDAVMQSNTALTALRAYKISGEEFIPMFDLSGDGLAPISSVKINEDDKLYIVDGVANGEEISFVTMDRAETTMTGCMPIKASNGETVACVFAEVSMSSLKTTSLTYAIKMIAIQFGLSVLILAYAVWYAQERLVVQINAVVSQTESFRVADKETWLESDAWKNRTEVHSGDEIEELYKSICSEQETVSNNVKELKHSKELEQKNKELAIAIRYANEASAAKSDFLSRMSHDIRTPLNGIIGMTQIALNDNKDAEVGKSLEIISSSSHFLLSLINDILDISKIESGSMKLNEQPVPLEDFDKVINSVIRPLMENKHITFDYKMQCGMTCAVIDPVRFNQIFFNLLSNASKFTPEGGRVEFSAMHMSDFDGGEWVRFTVRDNGIGMKPEFIKHAFEPFEQDEEHNGKLQNQGTGLGLAITKELVELMGGRINVKSTLGEGSTFDVELPLKSAQPADLAKAEDKNYETDEVLRGKNMLLAEDNKINATVATRLLAAKGVTVVHAENGQRAVELFSKSTNGEYDAVLMDIRMPVLGGLDATRQIRALERADAKAVPIIAMTANAFEDDVKQCIEAGMNAHLAKPIEPELMYETIARALAEK